MIQLFSQLCGLELKNRLKWPKLPHHSLSFSFLSVLGDYGSKNFSFRENWVGSEMAGMKITVFVIFDQTWTHNLAPKRPKYGIPETEF